MRGPPSWCARSPARERNNVRTASTHRARHAVSITAAVDHSPRSVTALLAVTALVVLPPHQERARSARSSATLGTRRAPTSPWPPAVRRPDRLPPGQPGGQPHPRNRTATTSSATGPVRLHWLREAPVRTGRPGGPPPAGCPRDTAAYWAPSLVYTSGTEDRAARARPAVHRLLPGVRGPDDPRRLASALPPDVRLVATDVIGYGLTGWTCGAEVVSRPAVRDADPGLLRRGRRLRATPSPLTSTSRRAGTARRRGTGRPRPSTRSTATPRDNADFTLPDEARRRRPATAPDRGRPAPRDHRQYVYTGNGSDVALTSDAHAMPGMPDMAVDARRWLNVHSTSTSRTPVQPGALKDYVARCVQTRR